MPDTLETPGAGEEAQEPPDRARPRGIGEADWRRFEANLAEIFRALGLDLDTPGTQRTPHRYLKALYDATSGYEGDPNLITAFPTESRNRRSAPMSQVIEGPIPFYALCEHHAFPFFGHAYVGYIAEAHLLGISKLTRIVRLFANRFTVQERMGEEIADLVDTRLQPFGVAVYLRAVHLCTQMRGVREHESTTWTTFWRGRYEDDPALRSEFLSVCQVHAH